MGRRRISDGLRGALLAIALGGSACAESDLDFFERRVRPVLVERCHQCHSATAPKLKGGLRLDSAAALRQGGDSGPAVTPGDPETSRLIAAIRYATADLQMPPKGKLPDPAIADLTEWVRRGAPWPEAPLSPAASPPTSPAQASFDLAQRKQAHWAWKPVTSIPIPAVRDVAWVRQPTDAFVLARLEQAGLKPAATAEPRTLIRRLAYDLTGLPPDRAEIEAFARDPSPAAWEQTVARFLASPRFGERWARHWLDLVRYADTLGHEFDYPIPNAWRYRDYVIRALNADVPYDQFAREHLAGDLLDPPRRHPTEGYNESIIGTAFYWLGQRPHSPVDIKQHQADVVDDQIDVLSKTFLGLTVACARCHDHKFDAISTRDYYALYGILASSRYAQRTFETPPTAAQRKRDLAEWRARLEHLLEANNSAPAAPGDLTPASVAPTGDRVFVDFARDDFTGWFRDGGAFGDAPASANQVVVLETNRVAILNERCAHSAATARRLQGTLSSPTFVISNRFIHLLAAGRASRINVPIEGHTMIRDPIYGGLKRKLDHDEFRWLTVGVEAWQGRRAFLEFSDLPTPDLADDAPPGGYGPDGYVAVARVVFSDSPQPPASGSPAGIARLIELAADSPEAALAARFRTAEAGLGDPLRVPAMLDGTGLDEVVFVRGNHRNRGENVPRRFLEALLPNPIPTVQTGSGRSDLAQRITAPENPLFARVLVNRVWSHLFGRGLVATPDDFGVLGQAPSHPELLDWLADWFRTEGRWSVKRLLRLLVTSSAYRMSSRPDDPRAEESDPANVLWHRMPIRRLEGESIRDAILATSGRLDLTMYGPGVPVHLTEFMEGRGRPGQSGPLDGDGRRSVYLEVRRNFLSPMLRAFDSPVPFTTVGRRTVSNVPAQSLMLLNDPFVHAQAAAWARQLIEASDAPAAERLDELYRRALGRPPTPAERQAAAAFLDHQICQSSDAGTGTLTETEAWTSLCHVVFNLKEFIYLD